ncbi:histidine phosphatase family protein [Nocardioides taihuensis]|uniref:Histidine phosphatase family protein n=1 Tax=Nocardioides taihuensis TaxID=1835606 RepID=A0ABW0BME5_9ACTN
MTRRVVLVRHGRTDWNHRLRVQGQSDSALDEVGRAQADAVAPVLAALRPVLLWSSDLARARDTALTIGKAAGLDPVYDARLREFSLGEREGLTHDEYRAADPEEFEQFRRGHYDTAPGAEPASAVRERMREVVGELLAALEPGQTGIAVSHGGAIRVATGALLGWPDDQFHTLRGLSNCGWVVLEEHPEVGALRLAAYNRTAPPTPDFVPRPGVG